MNYLSIFVILSIILMHLATYDIVEGKKDELDVINNGCGKICYEGEKKKGPKIKLSSGGCCKKGGHKVSILQP